MQVKSAERAVGTVDGLAPTTGAIFNIRFKPTVVEEPSQGFLVLPPKSSFQSITIMSSYSKFSFEELRLADYSAGYKPATQRCHSSASAFTGSKRNASITLYPYHPPKSPFTSHSTPKSSTPPHTTIHWPRNPLSPLHPVGPLTTVLLPHFSRNREPYLTLQNLTSHIDFYATNEPFRTVYAASKQTAFAQRVHHATLTHEKAFSALMESRQALSPLPSPPSSSSNPTKPFATNADSLFAASAASQPAKSEAALECDVAGAKARYHTETLALWTVSKFLWEEHYASLSSSLRANPPRTAEQMVRIRRELDTWEGAHLSDLAAKLEKKKRDLDGMIAAIRGEGLAKGLFSHAGSAAGGNGNGNGNGNAGAEGGGCGGYGAFGRGLPGTSSSSVSSTASAGGAAFGGSSTGAGEKGSVTTGAAGFGGGEGKGVGEVAEKKGRLLAVMDTL